jgi:hypothetical protein
MKCQLCEMDVEHPCIPVDGTLWNVDADGAMRPDKSGATAACAHESADHFSDAESGDEPRQAPAYSEFVAGLSDLQQGFLQQGLPPRVTPIALDLSHEAARYYSYPGFLDSDGDEIEIEIEDAVSLVVRGNWHYITDIYNVGHIVCLDRPVHIEVQAKPGEAPFHWSAAS